MKRWKALVLLGTLCLGLLLPWQAAAQEEPAGQLAEESGAAGVTEQLDWDVQSVLEQLGQNSPCLTSGRCSRTISPGASHSLLPCWADC